MTYKTYEATGYTTDGVFTGCDVHMPPDFTHDEIHLVHDLLKDVMARLDVVTVALDMAIDSEGSCRIEIKGKGRRAS